MPPPAPAHRTRALVAAGAVLALVLVAAAVASRPEERPRPSATPSQALSTTAPTDVPAGTPTDAEAEAVLDRMARAVLERDRAAYAAALDRSSAAAPFRQAQLETFDNLTKVPFSVWSYAVATPLRGGDVIKEAAARYAAPTFLARVELSYALRGIDTAPSTKDLWLTFVRRSDGVRVAGDSDVESGGGVSWRGPWDYGPLVAHRGVSSLVLGHPRNAARLPALASIVDLAVPVVTRVWGTGWPQQVAVLVPDTQEEMSHLVGGNMDLSAIAAASIADTVADGVATGQRVVMNPANLDKYGPIGARIVVQHEVTHIATRPTSGAHTPAWLVEGFADYVGNLGSGQTPSEAAGELRAEVVGGRLPTRLPGAEDFDSRNKRAAQAYEEAWLACRLIADLAGEAALVRMYRAVGAAKDDPGAVERELRRATGLSMAQFVARWRAYLRTVLV